MFTMTAAAYNLVRNERSRRDSFAQRPLRCQGRSRSGRWLRVPSPWPRGGSRGAYGAWRTCRYCVVRGDANALSAVGASLKQVVAGALPAKAGAG